MTVWTYLKTTASDAASAVYGAASGFNNLGTGNTRDPSSYRYEGRLGHRSVTAQPPGNSTNASATSFPKYVPPPECPYGYYDHGNGNIESCPARSKDIAPDGCSFEGRYAECHANGTGEWNHDLSNCMANDYWRLTPQCTEVVCQELPAWQQVGLGVLAVGGLIYGAKKVIIVGRNIFEKCKAAYQAFWETPVPHNARDLELDSVERGSPENSDTSTPETSFNTPS